MEKKSEPRELMTLDNFTVDYTDVDVELKKLGGKHFFNAVKEGDNVTFASDEESERQLWIQALYRATGQSHKPTPPTVIQTVQTAREQGGNYAWFPRIQSLACIDTRTTNPTRC
jgi:hypothetical protein